MHRTYFPEYPAPNTSILLELDEGLLFVSYPAGFDAAQLREGMVLTLQWTDGEDQFGHYHSPVFRPVAA